MAPTPKLFKVRKSLHHYIGSLRDNVIYSDLHLHGCDHMYNHKNTNHEVNQQMNKLTRINAYEVENVCYF